ncbi:hypothetical protein KPB2_5523 [Klebsiella pneumoniae Kb677]|nr:hypothetical protein KPB2_5523 [Klebsiella pneumoniae Kb677]
MGPSRPLSGKARRRPLVVGLEMGGRQRPVPRPLSAAVSGLLPVSPLVSPRLIPSVRRLTRPPEAGAVTGRLKGGLDPTPLFAGLRPRPSIPTPPWRLPGPRPVGVLSGLAACRTPLGLL